VIAFHVQKRDAPIERPSESERNALAATADAMLRFNSFCMTSAQVGRSRHGARRRLPSREWE